MMIIRASVSSAFASRVKFAIGIILRPARGGVRWPVWQSITVAVGGFIVLFILTMTLFDVRAITAARELPPAVIALFRAFTDLGKAGLFLDTLPVAMIALCFVPADLPRPVQATFAAIFARVAFVFFAIGVPYWLSGILKQLVGRARPFVGGSANAYLYQPFTWGPAYASLPSGHAVTACAAAVAIAALFPRLRTLMWLYAIAIIVSRVVVTAHHPSDVLAGALIGIVGALFVRNYFAARRLVFAVTLQGDVEAFAGPSWRRLKAAVRSLLRRQKQA